MKYRVAFLKMIDVFMFKKDSQIPHLVIKIFRKAIKVIINTKSKVKDFVIGFKV